MAITLFHLTYRSC